MFEKTHLSKHAQHVRSLIYYKGKFCTIKGMRNTLWRKNFLRSKRQRCGNFPLLGKMQVLLPRLGRITRWRCS